MSNCVEYLNVRYCFVNNTFIVGDNKTRALISDPPNGILFIPFKIKTNEIKEIGAYSFKRCKTIEQVTIEARITQINDEAFRECEKLERINIPNTCKIIKQWGIQTYNFSMGSSNIPNPYKSINVIFEPNSNIKYIDTHGISYRVNTNIYTCERIKPLLHKYSFLQATNLKIFSPVSFKLNNTRSITKEYSSQCKRIITIQQKCSSKSHLDIFIFILFVSS